MSDSKLKMNDDKTKFIAIGTNSKISQVAPNETSVSISCYDVPFSQFVEILVSSFFLRETLSHSLPSVTQTRRNPPFPPYRCCQLTGFFFHTHTIRLL